MPSVMCGILRTLFSVSILPLVTLAGVVNVSPAGLFPRATSGCSTTGPVSCHNATTQSNLCCFESPGVSITLLPNHFHSYSSTYRVFCCKHRYYILMCLGKLPLNSLLQVLGHDGSRGKPSDNVDRPWFVDLSI